MQMHNQAHIRIRLGVPLLSLRAVPSLPPPFSDPLSLETHTYTARSALSRTQARRDIRVVPRSLTACFKGPRVISRRKAAAAGALRMKPNRGTPSTISSPSPLRLLSPYVASRLSRSRSQRGLCAEGVGGDEKRIVVAGPKANWF